MGERGVGRKALGLAIRKTRVGQGISLRTMATELGVSPATLSAIETGRTGVDAVRLARIARALDIGVQDLIAGLDESSAPPIALPVEDTEDRPTPNPGVASWRDFPPLDLPAPLVGALAAFVELGYHAATIRDIARRARLSVPGLYHHYPGKHDLLAALLDLSMADLAERIAAARAEGYDPVQRFSFVVECLALFHTHRYELGVIAAREMRNLEPAPRERMSGLRRAQQQVVEVEVEAAVGAGRFSTPFPREASRAVVTMCTALAQWYRPCGPTSAEQIAQVHVRLALDLMGCREPVASPATP
jgi:AcrR family transcriptional regulator/DNA-binding XRE family transcriptional regulator